MAAFLEARRLGADAVELDVHATADGHVVVLHDYDLARTTSGTGLVHERDLAYVRSLSAGAWFGPEFEEERVPLLSEVLGLDGLGFELEVKGLPAPGLLDGIAKAVRAAGAADRALLTGPHLVALAGLGALLPGAKLGLFPQPFQPWMTDHLYEQLLTHSALSGGFELVYVPAAQLAKLDVGRIHNQGIAVQVLVPPQDEQSEDFVASVFAQGADGVTINEPEVAIQARARSSSWPGRGPITSACPRASQVGSPPARPETATAGHPQPGSAIAICKGALPLGRT